MVPTRDSCAVRLVVDCVEPNPEGQTYLLDFARRTSDRGIEVVCHDSTVEDFLSTQRPDYDAILCCHSFYYINKDQWTSILRRLLRSCLAKNHIHLSRVILSMAMRIRFSAVAVNISKSLANRRNPPNQAKVRSTIQRLGSTVNPSPSFVTRCKATPGSVPRSSPLGSVALP
jgi:hypothetical protein